MPYSAFICSGLSLNPKEDISDVLKRNKVCLRSYTRAPEPMPNKTSGYKLKILNIEEHPLTPTAPNALQKLALKAMEDNIGQVLSPNTDKDCHRTLVAELKVDSSAPCTPVNVAL